MSFVTRQAAHCDQCSHEWLVVGASTPTHCAKCKSRRWNKDAVKVWVKQAEDDNLLTPKATSSTSPIKQVNEVFHKDLIPPRPSRKDIQALRDICAGKIPTNAEIDEEMARRSAYPVALAEVPICGKTWWEEGDQYECLMDKGHREALAGKHGLRGMVQRLED